MLVPALTVVAVFLLLPLFGAGLLLFTVLSAMLVLLLVSYPALPPGSKTRVLMMLALLGGLHSGRLPGVW